MRDILIKILLKFGAALWLVFSMNAFAVDCNNPPGGIDAESAQINYQCAEKDRHSADLKLNQAYKKLVSVLKDDPDSGLIPKTQIVYAQRAWVAFRDAECDLRTSVSGGARQWLIVNHSQCLTELTEQRTKTLQDYLKQVQDQ
ncbi:lysozyme inhibitor LprI family protein [Burkholderia metallica]|uniref:lysozyme inhibitor LprI family protein n=1 Tax=Burkholderia metallica TaxID=488729 RepID=UPI001CF408FC|nr:lysozyme inhibitor LprI family protein [Burkholderia metallica]MCA8023116.1 lysozyme inhibitor LprI family protein [Burkholderia metallica]